MNRLLAVVLLLTFPAAAQKPNKPKQIKPKLAASTDSGKLGNADYKIEIPVNWNHGLVIYCHGYSDKPVLPEGDQAQDIYDAFLREGYAVARSGYSAGGWAIEQAVQDTQALRKYFAEKYGTPKETYVTGHSMGGFLTMTLIETHPEAYDAGLALCGPLAPATWFMERLGFDGRVVFDYYFQGVLPSPAKVPSDFEQSDKLVKHVEALLSAAPQKAQILRRYMGVHTNPELARGVVFATYVLKDLQQRSGGNPFDNRSTIYTNAGDDNKVNDGVQRYAADPGALAYVQSFYTPTGNLQRPILAVHTTYDEIVPPRIPNEYGLLTRQAGHGNLFVQQYVKHDGHCHITPDEISRAFAQLRAWKQSGTVPPSGWNH